MLALIRVSEILNIPPTDMPFFLLKQARKTRFKQNPPTVVKTDEGYLIVEGRGRVAAADQADVDEIWANILPRLFENSLDNSVGRIATRKPLERRLLAR